MENITFAIHTLGCRMNTYESDLMSANLRAAGFEQLSFEERADVYIINTCTVTNIADRKSRQMLHKASRLNPEAVIVAAGCHVEAALKDEDESLLKLLQEAGIDLLIKNSEKADIAVILQNYLKARGKGQQDGQNGGQASGLLSSVEGHTRAFIKIQDGCNQFCTYCIIPYVRGRCIARPEEEIFREIRGLTDKGIREIVLTGIHISSLGEEALLRIIHTINDMEDVTRIRMGSLEPRLITEDFVRQLVKAEKLCPHFHLSLQSGSETVLKRMNRHYTPREYLQSASILREYYDRPALTTDIIVGFPGETEKEFEETLEFAEKADFYEAHVFRYSRRHGTRADRMPGQLTEKEKMERSNRLIEKTEAMSHAFRTSFSGQETQFLSEELITINGKSFETGYTPQYVRAVRAADTLHKNVLVGGVVSEIRKEKGMDEFLLLV